MATYLFRVIETGVEFYASEGTATHSRVTSGRGVDENELVCEVSEKTYKPIKGGKVAEVKDEPVVEVVVPEVTEEVAVDETVTETTEVATEVAE